MSSPNKNVGIVANKKKSPTRSKSPAKKAGSRIPAKKAGSKSPAKLGSRSRSPAKKAGSKSPAKLGSRSRSPAKPGSKSRSQSPAKIANKFRSKSLANKVAKKSTSRSPTKKVQGRSPANKFQQRGNAGRGRGNAGRGRFGGAPGATGGNVANQQQNKIQNRALGAGSPARASRPARLSPARAQIQDKPKSPTTARLSRSPSRLVPYNSSARMPMASGLGSISRDSFSAAAY